ncbi:DNA/RNA nuclease SfsA [Tistrella sp. BH-R2-4]|uniref:Sugar fermentation stimulation protein homolog n=1 Tax=Tistrella arctica TaxID=3133430 RepID=A0ABU9YDD5_9PROT
MPDQTAPADTATDRARPASPPGAGHDLVFTPMLTPARLVRRYKRFLADVVLPDGTETTVHVANPGSMLGLADAGARIWLQRSADPKRKLPLSWVLVEAAGGALVVVDTGRANGLVAEAITAGRVPALAPAGVALRREVRYGTGSRVDIVLDPAAAPTDADAGMYRPQPVYVEVKSVTLSRQPGQGAFPDARTQRGARHLAELAALATAGTARAVLVYAVMRGDVERVDVAADIDPAYAAALAAARAAGVEVMALGFTADAAGIRLTGPLPVAGQGTSAAIG